MNQCFEEIGNNFVKHYYKMFDRQAERPQIMGLYTDQSLLTFEGNKFMGAEGIRQKLLQDFSMGDIERIVTTVDSQPFADGAIAVFVLGQLWSRDGNDKPMGFSQMFILRPTADKASFYIANDMFRLTLHNHAA